jgi:hypothetical protein
VYVPATWNEEKKKPTSSKIKCPTCRREVSDASFRRYKKDDLKQIASNGPSKKRTQHQFFLSHIMPNPTNHVCNLKVKKRKKKEKINQPSLMDWATPKKNS